MENLIERFKKNQGRKNFNIKLPYKLEERENNNIKHFIEMLTLEKIPYKVSKETDHIKISVPKGNQ